MSHLRQNSLIASLALGLAVSFVPATSAFAGEPAPKGAAKGQKSKPAEKTSDAPMVDKQIAVSPRTLTWGIDRKKVGEIYDKVIDDDYKARYRKIQPGSPEMASLDAEVAEKKAEFRRSYTEFNGVATGYDQTPLQGEYTYLNKESLLVVDRNGKVRYFFFIQGKLWKIVDVIKLGEKSKWGKEFADAAALGSKAYGVAGRVRDADAAQGRPFTEVDWKDSNTHVRAVDWGGDQAAFIFEDNATLANLAALRPNKLKSQTTIDARVKDAGRKEPTPPKPDDKKPGAKK